MKIRLSTCAAASSMAAVLMIVSVTAADQIVAAYQASSTFAFNCEVDCSGTKIVIGQCFGSQSCCGYRNGKTGSEQHTCCNSNQHCDQDLNAVPIVNRCLANP